MARGDQPIARGAIVRKAIRLLLLTRPGEPEPREVAFDGRLVLRLAAGPVGVVRRKMKVPPCRLANSQLKSAARILPTCSSPVGLGAKRTIGATMRPDLWREVVGGSSRLR